VHKVDARVKFILTLAFILTAAFLPFGAWPQYILLLAVLISLEIASGIGVSYVFKRSALAIPFLVAALPLIFTVQGPAAFTLEIGSWQVAISQAGLERFLSIVIKSWVSVQAAILLASTTPFPELLAAMRAVGIPRLIVAIFGLMWRYMFVLGDEGMRLIRARTARSSISNQAGLRSGRNLAWRASIAGGMAGNLMVRSLERSDRIYFAMLSRGYDGEVRTLPPTRLVFSDWVMLILGGLFLSLLLLFSLLITV
jgi:cobalt/nickel transport system permease protein